MSAFLRGSGNVRYQPNVNAFAGGQLTLFGVTLAFKTPVTGGPQKEAADASGMTSEQKFGKTESSDLRLMLTLGSADQF